MSSSITGNNIFDFGLKVFLLICPIVYVGGLPAKDVQLQCFIIGVMILFGLSLLAEQKREYVNVRLGLFFLWVIVNIICYKFHPVVIAGATQVFLGLLLFYLILIYVQPTDAMISWLLLLIPLNVIVVAMQLVGHDFINKSFANVCGLMQSPSHLGTIMVLLAPLAIAKKWWFVFPALFCLFAARSVTPMFGMAGAIAFYYWHKGRNKWLISGLAITIAGAGFLLNTFSFVKLKFLGRLEIWEQALQVAFTKPLQGMGIGTFPQISKSFHSIHDGWWEMPQNVYIGVVFALGVTGLILLLSYIFDFYKRVRPHFSNPKVLPFAASLVGLLIIMLGQSCMEYTRIFVPAIAIVAFTEINLL